MQVKRCVCSGLVAFALVVGLAACGGSSAKSVGSGTADVVAKDSPTPHFDPNTLKASANSDVSFTLKNEGKVVHNFTLSFLGVDQDVPPGQTVQVKFHTTNPPKGLNYYTFYDKNYQADGMQGRLNVG
ncbi:MAG: cupredoxin domain-containing protein [Acidimicrobiales bacterium]